MVKVTTQSTRNDAKIPAETRKVLMASTRRSPYTLAPDAVLPIRVSAPSVGNTCYFSDAVSRTPTEPLANEQRNFNVEPVVAERPASALDGALDPVLDGIGMQVELVSRRFVAAATA